MALRLHLVPHTHWDREWYLPYQVFRMRLVRLMDRLLDLLDQDRSYRHFMLDGQTIVLEDYLEIRPEREKQLAQFISWGRLSIGPWHVLPDEFLVGGESLVRNLMLGDRIARRFGDKMAIGYTPDPFGHIAQLPQILNGFGIETAVFRRGLAEEPAELWWESPDGSRVFVSYLRDSYDNAARLPTVEPEAFVAAIRRIRDSLAPHVSSGHILLLAGTDHHEAQLEIPRLIRHANAGRLNGDRLVHGSLTAYIEAVREAVADAPLPIVKGELRSPQRHHLLPGVLSTRMWIKQRNDELETFLTRWVEPFTTWADLLEPTEVPGKPGQVHLSGHEPLARVSHPDALIWRAWRFLLENHPHDSICGCSIDQVHREMGPRFDQAEQIGAEITRQSLASITDQIDTRGTGNIAWGPDSPQPVVVFNPVRGPRSDAVTARLRLPGPPDGIEVVGPDGRVAPHQVLGDVGNMERSIFQMDVSPDVLAMYIGMVEGGRLLNYVIHDIQLRQLADVVEITLLLGESGEPDIPRLAGARAQVEALMRSGGFSRFSIRTLFAETHDLVFIAPELPGYGYATFTVRAAADSDSEERRPATGPNRIENDLIEVEVDTRDGTLTLTDKTSGAVYQGLNRFVDGGDRGDEYNYCQPEEDHLVVQPAEPPSVRVVEAGPARQTLEVSQVYRLPEALRSDRRGRSQEIVNVPIASYVNLLTGVRRVEIETRVDNRAQDHRLRVHFPVPVRVDHAYTAGHFHVATRPIPPVPEDLDTSGWVEQPAPTVPQRGWADVSTGQVGLMVANRGLPEVEFMHEDGQTVIALTLLRCVGWLSRSDLHCRPGHAGPGLPTPEAQCLGPQTFHYALIPHEGDWQNAFGEAEAFRAPLRAVVTGVHEGTLPAFASLVEVDPPAFRLTAIKQLKEGYGPGLVVRGVNLSEQPITVRLRPRRVFAHVARVNLNEELIEPLLPGEDGSVVLRARPWEIVTVRWRDV